MFIYQRVYIKLSMIDQGDITMSGGNSTYSTGAVIDPATFDWKKKNFCSTWSNRKAARKIAKDTMKPDEEVCFELPIYVGWKISAWLLVEIFLHKRYYLLFHVICSKEDKLLTVGHPVPLISRCQGSTSSECLHWAHIACLKAAICQSPIALW